MAGAQSIGETFNRSRSGRHEGGCGAGGWRPGRLRGVEADTAGGRGATGDEAWAGDTGALRPGLVAGIFIETRMSGVEGKADLNFGRLEVCLLVLPGFSGQFKKIRLTALRSQPG